jgi:Zn-finger nucleic acid-binding protein
MKIEKINCPNCGASVSCDSAQCLFCRSRLKTMACPSCFGLMFIGSRHCSHCGAKTVQPEIKAEENSGDCPRCKIKLQSLQINEIVLRECQKCVGLWADVETFENVCANNENQAAVLGLISTHQQTAQNKMPAKISYVPCPECRQLMNRNNFARSSGVIIDVCKQHGIWFDAEELPKIIEFIRVGGLEHARRKEKLEIEAQKSRLRDEQMKFKLEQNRFKHSGGDRDSGSSLSIREFIRFLFD